MDTVVTVTEVDFPPESSMGILAQCAASATRDALQRADVRVCPSMSVCVFLCLCVGTRECLHMDVCVLVSRCAPVRVCVPVYLVLPVWLCVNGGEFRCVCLVCLSMCS